MASATATISVTASMTGTQMTVVFRGRGQGARDTEREMSAVSAIRFSLSGRRKRDCK
ncbi:MAG: hypothetical protein RLZZ200_75 [Pseudomonadota bacterium]|jgi:hypothetical protein